MCYSVDELAELERQSQVENTQPDTPTPATTEPDLTEEPALV